MSNNHPLTPIEQRTVLFYDDELTAVVVQENGRSVVYVPIRPICDFLGVDFSGQRQRIQRDLVLMDVAQTISVGVTPSDIGSKRPHHSDMLCLPLDFINGFLFGINASRVKPEVKEQLIRYQRECYRVLADAFLAPSETAVSPNPVLLQVREMGLAIARMAEEQIQLERRVMGRLDKAAVVVGNLDKRLTAVEQKLESGQPVSEEQAAQLSQAVKALAFKLGEKSGRSEFGSVYGELYRQFGITSYKQMPANQLNKAMTFLRQWYQSADGDDVPF